MHCKTTSSSWNDDDIARLRTLWNEGLTTSEIGRRLGMTKNAVIGKAWRLELPPRRAPIATNPVAPLAEIMRRRADQCFWPLGHPGTANFRLCSQPVIPGKPYCETHCRRAYVRLENRPMQGDCQ